MSPFEQRIALQTVRVENLERHEARLAKRRQDATARSAVVARSVELLVGQFPDVMIPDPVDRKWVLKPLPARLRERWNARRKAIVEIECPALGQATKALTDESVSLKSQTAVLEQRAKAARRSAASRSSGERRGWRYFFRSLARSGAVGDAGGDLSQVVREIAKLKETSHMLEQQQRQIQSCESGLQLLKERLDALEVNSID